MSRRQSRRGTLAAFGPAPVNANGTGGNTTTKPGATAPPPTGDPHMPTATRIALASVLGVLGATLLGLVALAMWEGRRPRRQAQVTPVPALRVTGEAGDSASADRGKEQETCFYVVALGKGKQAWTLGVGEGGKDALVTLTLGPSQCYTNRGCLMSRRLQPGTAVGRKATISLDDAMAADGGVSGVKWKLANLTEARKFWYQSLRRAAAAHKGGHPEEADEVRVIVKITALSEILPCEAPEDGVRAGGGNFLDFASSPTDAADDHDRAYEMQVKTALADGTIQEDEHVLLKKLRADLNVSEEEHAEIMRLAHQSQFGGSLQRRGTASKPLWCVKEFECIGAVTAAQRSVVASAYKGLKGTAKPPKEDAQHLALSAFGAFGKLASSKAKQGTAAAPAVAPAGVHLGDRTLGVAARGDNDGESAVVCLRD